MYQRLADVFSKKGGRNFKKRKIYSKCYSLEGILRKGRYILIATH